MLTLFAQKIILIKTFALLFDTDCYGWGRETQSSFYAYYVVYLCSLTEHPQIAGYLREPHNLSSCHWLENLFNLFAWVEEASSMSYLSKVVAVMS